MRLTPHEQRLKALNRQLEIEIKMPGGITQKIKTSNIKSLDQLKTSYMPSDLYSQMTKQELADLLAYLDSLKRK
jgi:putative heme-binding domain-containing protein